MSAKITSVGMIMSGLSLMVSTAILAPLSSELFLILTAVGFAATVYGGAQWSRSFG